MARRLLALVLGLSGCALEAEPPVRWLWQGHWSGRLQDDATGVFHELQLLVSAEDPGSGSGRVDTHPALFGDVAGCEGCAPDGGPGVRFHLWDGPPSCPAFRHAGEGTSTPGGMVLTCRLQLEMWGGWSGDVFVGEWASIGGGTAAWDEVGSLTAGEFLIFHGDTIPNVYGEDTGASDEP